MNNQKILDDAKEAGFDLFQEDIYITSAMNRRVNVTSQLAKFAEFILKREQPTPSQSDDEPNVWGYISDEMVKWEFTASERDMLIKKADGYKIVELFTKPQPTPSQSEDELCYSECKACGSVTASSNEVAINNVNKKLRDELDNLRAKPQPTSKGKI